MTLLLHICSILGLETSYWTSQAPSQVLELRRTNLQQGQNLTPEKLVPRHLC